MPADTDNPAQATPAGASSPLRQIVNDGLWISNPGLVQLLGLCPLLAVSNSLVNGLGLGIATLFTLLLSNTLVSVTRPLLRPEIRILLFVLIIASAVSVIELLMKAWLYDLYRILGIFLPLIVTNCMIIGRAEGFASRHGVLESALDALAQGIGFLLVLSTLGACREILGHGTLLRDAHLVFGEAARNWTVQLWSADNGFLLALLPPGAFLCLGLLLAVRNLLANPQIATQSRINR